ncbi:MAG: flagellar protein FliT [Comamonadaceae bacterium]
MNEQEQVLEIYGSLSNKTSEMVDSARQGDWDRLVELEHEYSALIERLQRTDTDPPANAGFRDRKVSLIRKVLADDAEIRRHTEPWMNQLDSYLGSARQNLQLQRAYRSDPC